MFSRLFAKTRSQYCSSGQEVLLRMDRTSLKKPSCKKVTFVEAIKCFPRMRYVNHGSVYLKNVGVYSAPLEAFYRSSTLSFRKNFQLQITPIDYHAFIVIETDYGEYGGSRWGSLERQTDGVYVSWCSHERRPDGTYASCSEDCRESVISYFNGELRPLPVRCIVKDEANADIGEVCVRIAHIDNHKDHYSVMNNNCQDFAKEVFNKYATLKTWDPLKIMEIFNPTKWFSFERLPFLLLMIFIAILGEIYFIPKNFYVQVFLALMLLVMMVLSFFINISHILTVVFGDPAFYLVLAITTIFNISHPSFLMKRGAEYCVEAEVNSLFYKFLASSRYVVIYLSPVFVLILRWVDKFVDKFHWRGLIDRISYRCKSHIIYRVCSLNDNLTSNDLAILLCSVFFFVHPYFFC